MISLFSLWLPIVLSAVFVFIVSSFIHMLLPYHRSDFAKIPREKDVMEALRPFDIPPGDYMMPCAGGPKEMKSPEFLEALKKGPAGVFTIMPGGSTSMAGNLIQWFLYLIVVSIFAAYIASRAVGAGAPYLAVFRFAGCTAFIGYTLALWQNSIWYKRKWSSTMKSTLDGLIYSLIAAGTFGWLWPA